MILSKYVDVESIKESAWVVYTFVNGKLNQILPSKIQNGQYSTKKLLAGTVVVLIVGSTLVKWIRMKNHFKKLGLSGPTPLPIMGNLPGLIAQGAHAYDVEILNLYDGTCGYFEGTVPTILTKDPKFIKAVMIKDSAYFVNRRDFSGLTIEPFDKFLTTLKDEEWKNVRSILSTSFTSAKLKEMTKLMRECSQAVDKYLEKMEKKGEEINTKTLFGGYALDVISSCLFGFEVNSLENPDNEFITHLQNMFNISVGAVLKFLVVVMFPRMCRYLTERGIFNFFSSPSLDFLRKVCEEVIERRRAGLEVRADFIQNMIEHEEAVKKEEKAEETDKNAETSGARWKPLKRTLTDSEILAQCILFMAAGYETTAQNLAFVAYNLATNPESQDHLCDEIDQVLKRHNGEINYDSVAEMKYMDMVISETLRLYPPAMRTDRVCNEDYDYNGIKITKGTSWNACIYALQHDPNYFPEPEKFLPERFSEDGKTARGDNEVFIPFGSGPRSCIGMRFALIESKIILAQILAKYKFVASEKTPKKIILSRSGLTRPVEPIHLKVKARP